MQAAADAGLTAHAALFLPPADGGAPGAVQVAGPAAGEDRPACNAARRQPVARPRRVVITGGSRGIGLAYVGAFASAGHRVLFTYNSTDAETVAAVISRHNCRTDATVRA